MSVVDVTKFALKDVNAAPEAEGDLQDSQTFGRYLE
jgi:hypothetical protein